MFNPWLSRDDPIEPRVFIPTGHRRSLDAVAKDGADRADPTHNAVPEQPSEEVEELRETPSWEGIPPGNLMTCWWFGTCFIFNFIYGSSGYIRYIINKWGI